MPTDTTSARRPLVLADRDSLDLLDLHEPAQVKANDLRPGMIIIDEYGFAIAVVDHRVASARNSGEASFLVENLEAGEPWLTARFARTRTVQVAAR